MDHLKKHIFKIAVVLICITMFLFMIITAIMKKDHLELIKTISIIVGFILYEIVDATIVKVLRKRTKHLDFLIQRCG